jgi:hypothetical protein
MAEWVGPEADADLRRERNISLCHQALNIRAPIWDQSLHVEVLVQMISPDVPAISQTQANEKETDQHFLMSDHRAFPCWFIYLVWVVYCCYHLCVSTVIGLGKD